MSIHYIIFFSVYCMKRECKTPSNPFSLNKLEVFKFSYAWDFNSVSSTTENVGRLITPAKKLEDTVRLAELVIEVLQQNEEHHAEVSGEVPLISPQNRCLLNVSMSVLSALVNCSVFRNVISRSEQRCLKGSALNGTLFKY